MKKRLTPDEIFEEEIEQLQKCYLSLGIDVTKYPHLQRDVKLQAYIIQCYRLREEGTRDGIRGIFNTISSEGKSRDLAIKNLEAKINDLSKVCKATYTKHKSVSQRLESIEISVAAMVLERNPTTQPKETWTEWLSRPSGIAGSVISLLLIINLFF